MVGGSGRKFRRRSSDAELAAEDVVVVVDLDALVGVEVEFDLRRRLERHRRESDLGGSDGGLGARTLMQVCGTSSQSSTNSDWWYAYAPETASS